MTKKKVKDLTYEEYRKICENHLYEYERYGGCDKCQFKNKKCGETGTYLARKDRLKEYLEEHELEKLIEREIEVEYDE